MENRRRQILAVVWILLLVIGITPIIETQSNLALSGSSGAELTGMIYDDEGVDADSDGLFDYLKVGVQVNVTESGIYRVSISGLSSSNSSYISIYKDKSMYLDVGLQAVDVSLHGPTIYLSGLNPVNVSSIYLYDTNWKQLSYAYNIPLSREYSYTEFDAPGASLTGVIFDNGTDTDGDSFFDFLKVDVQVNVTEPGIYGVSLSGLADINYSYISVYDSWAEYLEFGLQVINLSLNGPTIYASGRNPRYVSHTSLYDQDYNYYYSLDNLPLSREYSYTEFDAPPPPGASLTGMITDRGVDSDGDQKFDYLEVGVQINVTIARTYQVEISSLRDEYWNYTYVWDSESSYFDVGIHLLNVTLYGPTIHAYGFNPSYVYNMWLRDENGTYLDSLGDVPLSREYLYTEFDVPSAILIGVADQGVDTDSDGAFNYLEVSVEINVTEAGVYRLSLSELKDVEMNYIPVWDYVSTYFSEGTHLLNMSLDGLSIYSSGRNPRFVSYISLQDEDYNYLGRLDNVFLSREYLYNEFEHPTAALTDVIVDEGVDSDGDGSFDYLKIGVEINVTEAGEYRLYVGGLLDAELNYISVYDSKSTYLDIGLQLVNVSLWGPAIYVSGLDPRIVSWINLYDENGNPLDNASNKLLSRKYLHTEFDAPGAHLTGVISDKGTDSDDDGLFNYLEVCVEVNVTEAGFYRASVSGLEDASFSYISVYDSQYLYLTEGVHTVNLTLHSLPIYTSSLNPAFVSYIYLEDENYRNIGSLSRVALSREYSYTEFDPPKAVLTGTIYDRGVDTDGDGAFNYLEIGVEINISDPGNYRVEVSGLQDSSFNYIGVWGSYWNSSDVGVHVFNVSLDGPAIYASGLNPKYVSSIYLYDDYYSYLYNVPLSQEYLYTDFDPPGAMLTTVVSDFGDDTDGDGEFNYLQVGVEINVTEAGYYEVGVSGLLDADHNYIGVYDSEYLYLNNGTQVVHLSFDGLQIHLSGLNPRYVDYIWLQDENYRHIGSLDDVPLSREYSYTEFEAPSAVFTGTVYDQGIDTDGDGTFNYLVVGVEVNVTEAGTYEVSVDGLRDTDENWISVSGYAREYLDVGIHILNVSLDGLRIRLSGFNPRYINYISLRDENYKYLGSLDNVPLSREYSYSEFEAPGAAFTSTIYDRGIDTDGDGFFNYLEVAVEVNVTEAGQYSIHIYGLLDADFNYIDVWGSQYVYLDVGTQTVNISLSGLTIYLSDLDPKYINYLYMRDENYNQIGSLSNVPLSQEYPFNEFDPPGAVLTGVIFDQGVDTDADGTYDYLQIGVQVNVTDPGNYYVLVSGLLDSSFNRIDVYDSNFTFLDAGLQIVYLYLEGPRIYLSGRNPRYIDYLSLWDEKYTYHDYLNQVPLSREYSYNEFDPPAAMLTGNIYDRGVDTDNDGAFNYLEVGVEVNVTEAGTYGVSVNGLRDTKGNWISVWGFESGYLDVGLRLLNVSLSGYMIRSSRLNPRYVSYISLQADYYSSIYDVPLSREYLYTEFDAPAILTGVIFDRGIDTDADGSFDYLEVGVQINVSDPDTYVLSVSGLLGANSDYKNETEREMWYPYISVWDSKTLYLSAGVQTVNLYLYGPQIYVSHQNPVKVLHISLSNKQYTYYEIIGNVPLSREYSYTEFDAPFVDVETKFVVYPDGRVAVEGALKYTNMIPKYTGPATSGFFNLTRNGEFAQASTGLTLTLPPEVASEFPFNSTTANLFATYSNDLLNLEINSTMILPSAVGSQYPFNATDGTITITYSGGILNLEINGNTTLPPIAMSQFPFNATDITAVGTYSSNTLDGTITFSVLPDFTFDDVNVDFTGNETDLTLNGTVHIVFNVPLGDFIIRNETELKQKIDQLKSELPGIVWNMTGGLLNVTNLDIDYVLNGIGASVTFKIDVHGDFVRALAYIMSGGRNEMLLYPVLNEAYQSVQRGSFDIRYSHTTQEASMKLTFSYDLKRLIDYILTPTAGTTPYIITSYSMSPTLWMGDVVMVEEVSNASDIITDPETGDIIAFYAPSRPRLYEMYPRYPRVVIHRAINKTFVNGTWYFQTKGDANPYPDYWTGNNTYDGMISQNYLIGNVSSRIPLLGYLLSYPYYPYYYYYGYPYPQSAVAPRMSLLKAVFSSLENMSVKLSYSNVDKRFDFQLTLVDKLKALIDEIALILPETLPPETPPEVKSFVESLLNTTYASVNMAQTSLSYENGTADFKATATIEGDLNAELNYAKDLYFQLVGAQYSRYNMTIPWQAAFLNQTKVDVNNFRISAKLDETSFEGRIEGLTLLPPIDAVNATHFKLERLFNLTAPQYSWQREFPGQNQRLKITIEGGSNATHGITLFRDPTVPEPDATASHQMIWNNQTLSSLKGLVFNIRELNQYNLGWIVGKVVDADSLSPIVGASVTADGFSATTNTNGWYVIPDVPLGDYKVTVSAAGYATASKLVHLYSGITASANFEVTPVVHDVAIVSVVPSATEVYVGQVVNITVIVQNEGNATETFAVTYKYELEGIEYLVETQTVNNLAPLANTTLTFSWTTTNITVHTIKAEIPPLPSETDTEDNTMTSQITVKVKIMGDVDGDNQVDIRDIATAALAFGSYPDYLRWNPQADINQDNKVDIIDLVLIAKNFGKTYP